MQYCDDDKFDPRSFPRTGSLVLDAIAFELPTTVFHKSKRTKRWAFITFLTSIFFSFATKVFLPGFLAEFWSDKLIGKSQRFLLSNAKLLPDLKLKKNIISLLKNKIEDENLAEFLISRLPEVFYSKPIPSLSRSDLIVQGAPDFFLSENFTIIFLINRPLKIIGIQHGAGYGYFNGDLFFEAEKHLSDFFLGWRTQAGLSVIQHRFNKPPKASSKKQILWMERGRLPELYRSINYQLFKQSKDATPLIMIEKVLRQPQYLSVKKLRCPHWKLRNYLYEKSQIPLAPKTTNNETQITSSSFVIFDDICQTLIEFCLEFDICFVVVISTETYSNLSEIGLAFAEDLRRLKSLVVEDDEALLHELINKFLTSSGGIR